MMVHTMVDVLDVEGVINCREHGVSFKPVFPTQTG